MGSEQVGLGVRLDLATSGVRDERRGRRGKRPRSTTSTRLERAIPHPFKRPITFPRRLKRATRGIRGR
jgi:hypothetical protein